MEENYGIKTSFDSAAESDNLRIPLTAEERAANTAPGAPSHRSFDVTLMTRLDVLITATDDVPITTDARILGMLPGQSSEPWVFTYGATK